MNNGDEKHTELLTVQETAKLLKVPVSWVYGHTRKRSIDPLPGYRLGKYWRFREDEVLAWVGHSTPDITREIYLHAIPEEQRRAVESVERLIFGPKWTQVQAPTQSASSRVN